MEAIRNALRPLSERDQALSGMVIRVRAPMWPRITARFPGQRRFRSRVPVGVARPVVQLSQGSVPSQPSNRRPDPSLGGRKYVLRVRFPKPGHLPAGKIQEPVREPSSARPVPDPSSQNTTDALHPRRARRCPFR